MSIDYKDAGVDVTAGYRAVDLIKKHVRSTYTNGVIGDIGGFGGLFSLEGFSYSHPVLVSGADGVGTKLKYAFILDKHDTVGIDCVAMCVNDIICAAAQPLFFLDYYACGKLVPEMVERVVAGISEGCRQAGCALVGGESAEMPSFYPDGEYDLAGFAVGIAERKSIFDSSNIKEGDALVGLASNGLHSNGFSLTRKLLGEDKQQLLAHNSDLRHSFAQEVLIPTRIYVKPALELIKRFDIKGISHITGGGFIENIPRMLPSGIGAKIEINSYQVPPIFRILQQRAGIDNQKAYNTFNMGIGLVMAVDAAQAQGVVNAANEMGERAYIIGHAIKGEGVVL